MNDKSVCYEGRTYPNKQPAWECAKQLEKEKKKPMSVMKDEEHGVDGYLVYELLGCKKGAVYDHYVGQNEDWAKACAEALARISGRPHIAQSMNKRFLFADVWRVLETGAEEPKLVQPRPSKGVFHGIECASDLEKCCGTQRNMTCR